MSGAKPKALVLFVEDERAVREHLVRALSDEFEMQPAATGEEALKLVLKRHPDAVVTDIVMPGMDGIELVRLLRATPSTASIPILMISGRTAEELRNGFEMGADSYLGKPYTEDQLRVRIRGMLRTAQLRSETMRREERERAERSAIEEQAALLESITDAFYAIDREWRVTYVNRRALDFFQLARDDLIGKVLWDVFPRSRDSLVHRTYERAMQQHTAVSLELQSASAGRWLETRAYPHRDGLAVHFRDITDRKLANDRLRESETRLRLMSDALPALVCYMDREYRYRFCNARYEDWFGLSRDRILGRTMIEVLGAEAFATLRPLVDRALAGERLHFETRVDYEAIGPRDVHVDYVPDVDDGHVRGCYALVQDIGERKATELRLRESEARFRSLADHAPVMVWVTEADGTCTYLSRSWYEFTGQASTTGLGLGFGWLKAVHPEDAVHAQRVFAEANAQRKPYRLEYRLRRRDGRYAWAIDAAQPRLDEEGRFLGYVGSVIDIQERREAEERLRELNEHLEQRVSDALAGRKLFADVAEGTDAFMQVLDPDFRWLAVNRAAADEFEHLYGIRPQVGNSILDLLADRPSVRAAVQALWSRALAGEEFTELSELVEPSGRRRSFEMQFNTLYDKEGRFIGAYQFVYDVTQRMKDQARLIEAQDALRQSQKMETLGQLTGGVAHDFNNLLTPIVGALDMLARQYGHDLRTQRLTSGALEAADRARILIQRLLAFSRRQHLEPRAVDIGKLLEGVRELLARTIGPHIALSIRSDPQLPAARVDQNQLELALLNLAVNARDAMPTGGTLLVQAQEESVGRSQRLPAGRYVRIAVEDSGVGMDAETLSRAIEPFFTTKGLGEGTGLGLSMVHGLAAQLGGDFMLESAPGRGTTASLWLPVALEGVPELPLETRSDHEAQQVVATVLLVDDEPLVRLGTSSMLADAGYNVVEASTPAEALQFVSDGLKIDILITDFAMPGMNGAQLTQEIRKHCPSLPVLMITGFASLTETEAGGVPRLAKPFRQTELISSLAELVASTVH